MSPPRFGDSWALYDLTDVSRAPLSGTGGRSSESGAAVSSGGWAAEEGEGLRTDLQLDVASPEVIARFRDIAIKKKTLSQGPQKSP